MSWEPSGEKYVKKEWICRICWQAKQYQDLKLAIGHSDMKLVGDFVWLWLDGGVTNLINVSSTNQFMIILCLTQFLSIFPTCMK